MSTTDNGYLLIADITGYTSFLTASELDHARGILEGLFSAMLAKLQSPFVLSNVQGDAILTHARANRVADGHNVINTVEALYFGFAHELEQMINNTTCRCAACANMRKLDLKLFVHFGTYVEQSIGGRTELGGSDVILIHRLMKNTIVETTGIAAYAAFTDAAVNAIEVPEYFADAARHTETIEKFADCELFVVDMKPLWQDHRQRETVTVEGELWFPDVVREIAAPPDRCWHYLTHPDRRADWWETVLRLSRSGGERGRLAPGTVDHCAHGDGRTTVFTMRDVRPYDHITFDIATPLGGTVRETIFVEPTSAGSRITVRTGRPTTANPFTQTLLRVMSLRIAGGVRAGWVSSLDTMAQLAEREVPGTLGEHPAHVPVPDAVRAAVGARLPASA
jgi:uncharacterized protein YndB with AHSA1/START domain